jgi:hypothetical protein
MNLKIKPAAASLLSVSLLVWTCTSVSVFSPDAYRQAVDLKVVSLDLMEYATMPFTDYEGDVLYLKTELRKAYEFARGRPDNEISTRQWEILIDENRNLLGGFFKRWKEETTLPQMYVTEMQLVVSDAFDTIIGLESGKINPGQLK